MSDREKITYLNETIKNKYNNSPYRIPLRNRSGIIVEFGLVSEDDYDRVNAHRWHLVPGGYANSTINQVNIRMHHFVFKKPKENHVIDHINQDKLDNRRCNLHEITYSANRNNISKTNTDTSSKYKGVNYVKRQSVFRSRYDGIQLYRGLDEKQAAIMYDIYTFQQFGEHANNNRLISYDDAMKYEFPKTEKKQRELPDNIIITNGYYRVKKFFRDKRYTEYFKTLEEAQARLDVINTEIREILETEEREYLASPIQRNQDGIAYIAYKGQEILVSDEDWHHLNREPWFIAKNNGYVYNNDQQTMHRVVCPCDEKKKVVHHINGNRIDNRRENLEITSASANAHQRSTKHRNSSTSQYFGVVFHKPTKKWMARLKKDGISYYLGLYEHELDAAKAYNVKALELYGSSANVNLV